MPLSAQLLGSSHLQTIQAAVDELLQLGTRTGHPAPLPHQYVGTVLDNAACLLTAPANALDGGGRFMTPSEDSTWHSIMKAVHRAFLGSLQVGIEAGLVHMCDHLGIQVESGARARAVGLAATIRAKVDPTGIDAELRELETMGSRQPGFDDYLNPVVTAYFGIERQRTWRRFFRALSIVRNKASHFDTRLTGQERADVTAAGLGAMVDSSGNLQINPRTYKQLASLSLDFFDEAYQGMRHNGGASA